VNKVLDGYDFTDNPEDLLQKVLKECAVKPSLDLWLCGDPENFVFVGAGAPVETGASPYGKKVCQCKKGVFIVVPVRGCIPTPLPTGAGTVIINVGSTDTLFTL